MDKFQFLKKYIVLTTLCSSLWSRFIASTEKAFMDSGSSLTLHMHSPFNSICYAELPNLYKFIFSSKTVNRKYVLCRTLSTVASSSLVHQRSAILYIKQLPH